MPTLTIHIAVIWREYDALSQFIVREIALKCREMREVHHFFRQPLKILNGQCRYDTTNLTSEDYVSYPTASCCECTTHIQYIYCNSRYFVNDRISVLQNTW
jgi:hypothetical protein